MVIGEWDMILAFPPCTHLASSGAKHFAKKRADGRQQQGIDFFMAMVNAKCGRIMVENPVGIMSTVYRKPDQIIQPWMFGDRVQKTTCLWLKGLEPLVPWVTEKPEMEYHEFVREKDGSPARMAMWMYETRCLPYRERGKAASRTFKGIARAMAQSWGKTQEVEA